jgi:hypothetical protein
MLMRVIFSALRCSFSRRTHLSALRQSLGSSPEGKPPSWEEHRTKQPPGAEMHRGSEESRLALIGAWHYVPAGAMNAQDR